MEQRRQGCGIVCETYLHVLMPSGECTLRGQPPSKGRVTQAVRSARAVVASCSRLWGFPQAKEGPQERPHTCSF